MTGLWAPSDAAAAYDQLVAAAASARAAAFRYEAATVGVSATGHDARTISETSVAFEAVLEAARAANAAASSAAMAAELAAVTPPPEGRDQELERMELIVSFHEAGHAEYARESRIMVPVSAEIDVDRPLFFGSPRGCGMVMVRFTKDPMKWTERDYTDDAGCSLAGTAAEATWLQRVEGADYRQECQRAYRTSSGHDYGLAVDAVGAGTRGFRKAEQWAKELVTARWEHIVAMAQTLRDEKRMSAGQISRSA